MTLDELIEALTAIRNQHGGGVWADDPDGKLINNVVSLQVKGKTKAIYLTNSEMEQDDLHT